MTTHTHTYTHMHSMRVHKHNDMNSNQFGSSVISTYRVLVPECSMSDSVSLSCSIVESTPARSLSPITGSSSLGPRPLHRPKQLSPTFDPFHRYTIMYTMGSHIRIYWRANTDVSVEADEAQGVSWSVAREYIPRMLMTAMLSRRRLSRWFNDRLLEHV